MSASPLHPPLLRSNPRETPYIVRWNEISWPYNTVTDGENVTQEALADLLGIWDYIKNRSVLACSCQTVAGIPDSPSRAPSLQINRVGICI